MNEELEAELAVLKRERDDFKDFIWMRIDKVLQEKGE